MTQDLGTYNSKIDFCGLFNQMKNDKESMAFTNTQVKDLMFLDQQTLVAIEFHRYKQDSNYHKLIEIDEEEVDGVLQDQDGDSIDYKLGKIDKLQAFKSSKLEVIGQQIKKEDRAEFTKEMAEGFLTIYQLDENGGMRRTEETAIKVGRTMENLKLTRSADKRIVSLYQYDQTLKVYAWTTKLEMINLSRVNNSLISWIGEANVKDLLEVQLVGKCEILKIKYTDSNGVKNYTFFEVPTGNLLLEFSNEKQYSGQVEELLTQANVNGITILDLQVKEIREEFFDSKLVVFYAGDFLPDKDNHMMFKNAFNFVQLDFTQVFSPELVEQGHDAISNFIYEKIFNQINERSEDLKVYPYDHKANLSEVEIVTNRKFEHFAIMNQDTLYVNGLNLKDPYYIKLSKGSEFLRNSQVKDQIFYKVDTDDETKAICLKFGKESVEVQEFNVPTQSFDLCLSGRNEVFHLAGTSSESKVMLQTIKEGQETITRFSQQSLQGDFPVIAYNLGGSKLILNCTRFSNKKYILEMDRHEKFVSFVQFASLDELEFDSSGLNVSLSSSFLYMTTSKRNRGGNQLYLLFVDPYYQNIQIAKYQIPFQFDLKENDYITKAIVRNKKLWIQYDNKIVVDGQAIKNASNITQDSEGCIYYTQKSDCGGCCKVMNEDNISVFDCNTDSCLALQSETPTRFYLMDNLKNVYLLQKRFHKFHVLKKMGLQEADGHHIAGGPILLNEKYVIANSKIYYLFESIRGPRPNGVLEAEELEGGYPQLYNGSNSFTVIGDKIHVYRLPDKSSKVLIKNCEVATFVDQDILVQSDSRFMVFSQEGQFRHEVKFDEPESEFLNQSFSIKETLERGVAFEMAIDVQNNNESVCKDPPAQNKTQILKISDNGQYFLINKNGILRVYLLSTKNKQRKDESLKQKKKKSGIFGKKKEEIKEEVDIEETDLDDYRLVFQYAVAHQISQNESVRLFDDGKIKTSISELKAVSNKKSMLKVSGHIINSSINHQFNQSFKIPRKDIEVKSKILFDNVLFIFGAQYLRFAKMSSQDRKCKVESSLHQLNFSLDQNEDIIDVQQQGNKNIQVEIKDSKADIFKVIRWDMENNCEIAMTQVYGNAATIRGTSSKLMTSKGIIDLDSNLPEVLDDKLFFEHDEINTRKVNGSLTLNGNQINSHLNHFQLYLWRNIHCLGNIPGIIASCTSDDLKINVNGSSLYHHFADSPQVIEVLDKICQGEEVPLLMFNKDSSDRTALDLAIINESSKSFEIMMYSIRDFKNFAVSKSFLQHIPTILQNQSLQFFHEQYYQTLQMQQDWYIPIDDLKQEYVFASATSNISYELLSQKLGLKKQKKNSKKLDKDNKYLIRTYDLKQEVKDFQVADPEKNLSIQALDMDWIFRENNAAMLMKLLVDQGDISVNQSSLKIFVDMMWEFYHPRIIKRIQIPYLIYSVLSFLLCFEVEKLYLSFEASDQEYQEKYFYTIGFIWVLMIFQFCLFIFFMNLDIDLIRNQGLKSFWNLANILHVGLGSSYLGVVFFSLSKHKEIMKIENMRHIGSSLVMILWLKLIYWAKIDPKSAFHVRLMYNCIIGILGFLFVIFFIVIAFANFFFVIANNERQNWNTEITGYSLLDETLNLLQMGLMKDETMEDLVSIGGKQNVTMMLVAIFMISILFLTMLVAILAQTFVNVKACQNQNSQLEKIKMMIEYYDLINLKEIQNSYKYIIVVRPGSAKISHDVLDQSFPSVNKNFDQLNKMIKNCEIKASKQLSGILDSLKQNNQDEQKSSEDLQQQDRSYLKSKIAEVIKAFNNQICDNDVPVQDNIADIAVNWIDLVDTDGSGMIDLAEFQDSFYHLDGLIISDEEIQRIFQDFDPSGDGSISVSELARAIKRAVDESPELFKAQNGTEFNMTTEGGDYDQSMRSSLIGTSPQKSQTSPFKLW